MAFSIKIPFVIASHVKKYTSTTPIASKSKAMGIGVHTGALKFHNGTSVATVSTLTGAETLTNKTIASSATVPYVADATGAGSKKIASGTGTFVSGAATVATGLSTVTGFSYTLIATGFSTGATEVTHAVATVAPATGAVSVQGYRLMTTTASSSGTGEFLWVAQGT